MNEKRTVSPSPSRPLAVTVITGLLLFQGLSGLAGGIGLVADPTGASLQIPLAWLDGSPFRDYLVPGMILMVVLGFLPLVVAYLFRNNSERARYGGLAVGTAIVIWIAVEIAVIGYQSHPPLQAVYGAVGIVILVLLFLPSVQTWFENTPPSAGNRTEHGAERTTTE